MKRSSVALAALASLAAAFPVASAQATPRAILASVNLEREMAGLKPLSWNNDWASSCNAHTQYMEANGTLTHGEVEGNQLYSADGFWAGSRAVLARSTAGFSGNPWHNAPFHQFQVLHPWLAQTGVSITGGYACMVTMADRDAQNPSDISLATVPGTAQFTAPAEIARESPFTPGDEVGLPQGTKTGPHIYVYAQGPNRFTTVGIQNASLTATDGSSVELRWVDGNSARSGRFLDGGAILIPVVPLKENMQYGLRVEAATTAQNGTRLLISRTTSFVTGPDESDLVQSPEASDTVTAASRRDPQPSRTTSSSSTVKRAKKGAPVTIGEAGTAQLQVSLRWTRTGVKAKIHCASDVSRCQGPLRILVRRKGSKIQKLRFKARGGPLKLSLAPGRTIKRSVFMTKRQIASGKKRGFAVRWGAPAPEKARALEIQ
ncbi:MAG: CAP domain-containing protein [Solirubrobacteraceae bacterium]|nr:CAP domain-containing protein [Solirubrobacteraceae bacterium]